MDVKNVMSKVPWKKVIQVAGYVGAGIIAVTSAIDDDKKKQEYQQLKADVAKLKGDN